MVRRLSARRMVHFSLLPPPKHTHTHKLSLYTHIRRHDGLPTSHSSKEALAGGVEDEPPVGDSRRVAEYDDEDEVAEEEAEHVERDRYPPSYPVREGSPEGGGEHAEEAHGERDGEVELRESTLDRGGVPTFGGGLEEQGREFEG